MIPFEKLTGITLVREQQRTQEDKQTMRLLSDYDFNLFGEPGNQTTFAAQLLLDEGLDFLNDPKKMRLERIIGYLVAKSQSNITWGDVGGGNGMALRDYDYLHPEHNRKVQ